MKNIILFFLIIMTMNSSKSPVFSDDVYQKVVSLSNDSNADVVQWRRHMHAHPELSNRETETSRFVAERLREIGVDDIKTNVAHHGVVALVKGNRPGPCVALRADMDALPVTEQTHLPFASTNAGVMHACGHDVHTAVLLGAAEVLTQIRDEIQGTVKLVFQPAEEGAPAGEKGGASLMIEEGVMKDPDVAAFFALHIDPDLPVGELGYGFGSMAASADGFTVKVIGKQVHAARPWQGIDPIVVSAHIIVAMQTIASRVIDAREPIVVTVGKIDGGVRGNIIPENVNMVGTIRTHNETVRAQAIETLKRIVHQTAEAHGAKTEVEIYPYAPVVWNEEALGTRMLPTLKKIVGEDHVVRTKPMMGAEDFALFAQLVPSFYIRLGIRNEKIGAIHALHTPYLIVDENSIPLGVRAMSLLAVDFLREQKKK